MSGRPGGDQSPHEQVSVSCVAVILVLMLLWTFPAPSFWEILFIIVIMPAAAFIRHFQETSTYQYIISLDLYGKAVGKVGSQTLRI